MHVRTPRAIGSTFMLLALACLLSLSSALAQPSGEELARSVYDRNVGEDMTSHQIMTLIPAKDQPRVRKLDITGANRKGLRRSLLRFTAPADIKDTGFLTLEDGNGDTEQFLYLPALKRTRRIVAGQKSRSFVNTDFTFEDMERRPVEDSDHVITGEERLNGVDCWILESRPKPASESQYSMIRGWVAKEMLLPLKVDFFTGDKEPAKRYLVLQLENIQDIWTETKISMEDLKSGHKTVLETRDIKYNTGVQDSVFTQQALEQ